MDNHTNAKTPNRLYIYPLGPVAQSKVIRSYIPLGQPWATGTALAYNTIGSRITLAMLFLVKIRLAVSLIGWTIAKRLP